MTGSRTALGLLVCLVVGLAEPAAGQQLGQLSVKRKKVTKIIGGQQPIEMRETEPVLRAMQAETGELSAAKFGMGTVQQPQGAVTMGPESRFKFKEARFNASGLLENLDFEIDWGRFRFAMAPPLKDATKVLGQPVGVVRIERPGNPTLYLRGTDVYLYVTRDGTTTLYVEEGVVEIGEAGLRVESGQWTSFGPGLAPTPPARLYKRRGPMRPRPKDWDLPPPLFLALRFDLPR